jgi:hypothetical protein
MSRPSVRDELTRRLMEHLAIAETHPPEKCSLDLRSVAATRPSSGSERTGSSPAPQFEQDYFKGEIRKLTEDVEKERERCKGLAGRIAITVSGGAENMVFGRMREAGASSSTIS